MRLSCNFSLWILDGVSSSQARKGKIIPFEKFIAMWICWKWYTKYINLPSHFFLRSHSSPSFNFTSRIRRNVADMKKTNPLQIPSFVVFLFILFAFFLLAQVTEGNNKKRRRRNRQSLNPLLQFTEWDWEFLLPFHLLFCLQLLYFI